MDRRATPANGRVAHVSLRGRVAAERFTEGARRLVALGVAPLFDSPDPGHGRRQRELVLHEAFRVLEEGDGWAFGLAERDGYVGYLRAGALGPDIGPMTHVVAARQSYLGPVPELRNRDEIEPLSFGTRFCAGPTFEDGRWTEVARLRRDPDGHEATLTGFVPTAHLRRLDAPEPDPVAVAERFLGTPYHWGGNSGFGIDCSGLVQAAHLACAISCPGDSDQQMAALGSALPPGTAPRRGDLMFWTGHVALVADPATLIHANAHHMAVVREPLAAARRRIEAGGGGPVLALKRLQRRFRAPGSVP